MISETSTGKTAVQCREHRSRSFRTARNPFLIISEADEAASRRNFPRVLEKILVITNPITYSVNRLITTPEIKNFQHRREAFYHACFDFWQCLQSRRSLFTRNYYFQSAIGRLIFRSGWMSHSDGGESLNIVSCATDSCTQALKHARADELA